MLIKSIYFIPVVFLRLNYGNFICFVLTFSISGQSVTLTALFSCPVNTFQIPLRVALSIWQTLSSSNRLDLQMICGRKVTQATKAFNGSAQSTCFTIKKTESQSKNYYSLYCLTANLHSGSPCRQVKQRKKEPGASIYLTPCIVRVFYIYGIRRQSSARLPDQLEYSPAFSPCIIQSFPEVTAALYMQARRPHTRHTNVM